MNNIPVKSERHQIQLDDDALQSIDLRQFNNGKGPYSETDSSWKNTFKPGLKFFRDTVETRTGFTGGERVLDLLCGFGRWTPFLAEQNDSVIGVDVSADCINLARSFCDYLGFNNIQFINDDTTYIERFPTNHFDYVWMYSAMQYVERGYVMPQIWRVLKPGGKLFVADYTSTGLMIEHVEKGMQSRMVNEGAAQWAFKALVNGPDGDGNPNYSTLDHCKSLCERFGYEFVHAALPRQFDITDSNSSSSISNAKPMYEHYYRAIEFMATKPLNGQGPKVISHNKLTYRTRQFGKRVINNLLRRYTSRTVI